jgi:PRC-barrel domain
MGAVVAFIGLGSLAVAEEPGKVDLETAELTTELIGAPVYAADGAEVGQVADVSLDEDGEPARLRMTTDVRLGFGPRTVEVPKGVFMTLRGAVVLDLPADAIRTLPELTERDSNE